MSSPVSSTKARGPTINLSIIVGRRIILVVLFDKNTTPGLVRLRVRKRAQDELVNDASKSWSKKSQLTLCTVAVPCRRSPIEDIDNLFND